MTSRNAVSRAFVFGAMLLAAVVPLRCAHAEFSPAMQKVIAAAKTEGKLSLIWSATTLGGAAGAKRFEDDINKMFGTDIRITFTPGPSMPGVGNQIAAEKQAGRKASVDVYLAYSRTIALLHKFDLFEPVDWQSLLPGRIADENVEDKGTVIKAVTALPGILYNTQLAPEKPMALADFLKPEWKGKFASTPYAANFDILSAKDGWGAEKAIAYAKELSPQLAGLIRCDDGGRIASGEFVALVMTCSGSEAVSLQEKGAPVAHVQPRDFVIKSFFYFGIPRNAENPNAARLFIAYAMTPEGQKLIWETWQTDLHLFPGSHTSKAVEATEQAYGVKLKNLDIAWQLANSDTQEAWDTIVKIFTTRN
jgi:ABC-type Fe3+ transport system substrate-binding protein